MNQTKPQLEEESERDDAIIGVAVRYSLFFLGGLAVLGAIAAAIWLRPAPVAKVEPAPVDLPKVRTAVEKAIPEIPFSDITAAAGITFVHNNGFGPEKLLPETMGGGCAFLDFDSDGDPDILLVNSKTWKWNSPQAESTLALYANDGTGSFTDVTAESGLNISLYGQGSAVGDYDNDGDPDIYITAVAENETVDPAAATSMRLGPNRLFRNDGGRFVDITQDAQVSGGAEDWATSAGWFDYDNDGDLDLWVCNYVVWSRQFDIRQNFTLTGDERAYGRPQVFGGTYCHLYRNDGDSKFTDVSESAGLHINSPTTGSPMGKSLGLSFCDFDADGRLDVVVTNDTVQNFLFHNEGNGTFQEIATQSGIAFDANGSARGAMGIDIACSRNDVHCYSVAIGNFANEMSAYYVSLPDSTQFIDEAVANGIGPNTRLLLTFGVFFFDADLDGWSDLFHANGHLEREISKVQASQSYEQPPQLFWNAGADSETEFVPLLADKVGPELVKSMVGRGASYADIDADGDLDILIASTGQAPRLLRNNQQLGNNWLRVKLVGNGSSTNKDAIGAKVLVSLTNGVQQSRMVSPTRSYLSQVELPVTFGLGTAEVARLQVVWPNGDLEYLGPVKSNQLLTVVQE